MPCADQRSGECSGEPQPARDVQVRRRSSRASCGCKPTDNNTIGLLSNAWAGGQQEQRPYGYRAFHPNEMFAEDFTDVNRVHRDGQRLAATSWLAFRASGIDYAAGSTL